MFQSSSRAAAPQAAAVQPISAASAKDASQQPVVQKKATANFDLSGFYMFADPL